jgi:hypothetical protein
VLLKCVEQPLWRSCREQQILFAQEIPSLSEARSQILKTVDAERVKVGMKWELLVQQSASCPMIR